MAIVPARVGIAGRAPCRAHTLAGVGEFRRMGVEVADSLICVQPVSRPVTSSSASIVGGVPQPVGR